MKVSPESLNLIVPKDAEAKKLVTGLLKTTLDITPENDALKLDFSLQNIVEKDLSLYFSSSQKFDILITNHHGEEVYRWSHDKNFLTVLVDAKFRKDERLSFSEIWDYKDNEGNKVPPGEYAITVKLLAKLKNGKAISPDELTVAKRMQANCQPFKQQILQENDLQRFLATGTFADDTLLKTIEAHTEQFLSREGE